MRSACGPKNWLHPHLSELICESFLMRWRGIVSVQVAAASLFQVQDRRLSGSMHAALILWMPKTQFRCKSAHSQKAIRGSGAREVWAAAD
jgi:hypothetical protein